MSAPQFTPGPWEVAETDEGHEIRMGSFVGGWFNGQRKAPHHHVEYTHGIYVDDDYPTAQDEFAEAEANARLIAAAPDLYEAVEQARLLIGEGGQKDSLSEAQRQSNRNQAWHLLNNALAKARGEHD